VVGSMIPGWNWWTMPGTTGLLSIPGRTLKRKEPSQNFHVITSVSDPYSFDPVQDPTF
jgi:hypothetical protein